LNDVRFFVIVTGLALVILVLTFVLFRFFAIAGGGTGEAPRRNDQVRLSLAGFVFVFSLLFGAFSKLRADPA
jgi:hypothetical protein